MFLAASASLSAVGCGNGNRAAVSGTVTLDGKPLQQGVINFLLADGKGPSAGGTITDGQYEISATKGVMVGSNRVSISSVQPTGRKIQSLGRVDEEYAEAVPTRYNQQTTLLHEIQPGQNVLNFDLQGRIPIESIRRRYPGNP
ncbi:MAG: hypothetical protein IT427_03280 [Pirellulales bacterium]|nr:hypothetical protein [Pirellulales bacterium]